MYLLKRTFEQLKIAEMNDAKTKLSLISPIQSPIESGLATNKKFRCEMTDKGSIDWIRV